MNMHVATNTPAGRLTLLAALLAGLSTSAFAASPDLVISQIYGGGGSGGSTYNRDFIELFNRGSAPVALKGKSLQYASATGANWSSFNALPDVTLQPGQYFLVAGNPQTAGADIGAIDHNWAMSISATAGSVAVANTTAQLSAATENTIIDLVGYGGANRRETAPTAVLSISTQAQRLAAGCTDTDNNAGDFAVVGASLPRTANTPLNACGGTGPGPDPDPVAQPIVPSCPATLQVTQGSTGSAAITARDIDSIVNSAILSAGAVPGIELRNFVAASGTGATASATLSVAASLGAGSYPVTITFGNNDGQNASCSLNVSVGGQLTIPQIQGSAPKSSFAGTVQTTQGVVTAVISGGYFIQDPTGDGNPATSDGLYVFGSNAGLAVGDLVRVTGTVTEYTPSGATRSYTELTNPTATKIGTGSVAPTNVAMPNANLADVEGMLVRFTTPLTVNGNAYLGERGELTLSAGRREIPTNRYVPGSPEARALAASNAANMIVLDDGIFVTPTTVPYLFQDGTVRAGDTVTDLTGVVDFGAMGGGGASFKLQPTVTPTFSRTNERLPAPVVAGGNLRVASANVLNFFTTFTNGNDAWGRTGQGCTIGTTSNRSNCRGADNMAEFVRQRDKIVSSLVAVNADVVGLMEIQNNGDIAVGYLVEQLNGAMGANTYAVVPKPAATGTDAIRVAMIYKPSAVSLVGGALSDGDNINNRPPIAQTFQAANGGKFSLVVNHLKSKGSCGGGAGNTDSGDGQGCWNLTRVQQATRLRDYFLPQVVAAANDADVLIVGDMNAYGMEDPIRLLNAAGYVNEIERFVRPTAIPYSYVFGAESGYLDHALASSSLSPQVAGVTEWHNNADEPEAIDYNIESGTGQDPYQAGPYRASDHDPVVVSLNLAGSTVDVTAAAKVVKSGFTQNRVTGKFTGTVTITNTGSTPMTGPLHLVLQGLTAGVTLDGKSGETGGAPYLTLPGGSLAAGASVTVTTTFTNPSRTGFGYTAKLISGTF
ncbi:MULTISPECIES: ExeM/NucH family extracellular endonuclease [unclassified Massilia]|uniref:ExeM/NucH family extracellular endonuclease n=1 Tax=unclassified Massilia TaxID=2609279 RepID=UPI001785FEEC|nr:MULTISPECIES: ExeM/NucH family extracellular endonuclease [unclassified Massilia]MBD8531251.1 ExeM/NucH family extracellular endonuclease [Massilia sp. CFBP 13647]MBD8676486.1 ExeM/NucH family extracellular endonuclease [Massilia sp. CFBP 13721]